MVVLTRRSKLISFRVSPEEHEALSKSCMASGARSVAEFARTAVLQKVQSVPAGTLKGDLATLSRTLAELDTTLLDVHKTIRGVLGPSPSKRGSQSGETKESLGSDL